MAVGGAMRIVRDEISCAKVRGFANRKGKIKNAGLRTDEWRASAPTLPALKMAGLREGLKHPPLQLLDVDAAVAGVDFQRAAAAVHFAADARFA